MQAAVKYNIEEYLMIQKNVYDLWLILFFKKYLFGCIRS